MFRRKGKYSLSLAIVFAVFALALVMGGSQAVFAAEKQKHKEYVLGVPNLFLVSDWCFYVFEGIKDQAKELGMKIISTDAEFDYVKQNRQTEMMIRRRVDALVLPGGSSQAYRSSVEAAARANIPIINIETTALDGPTVKTEIASNQWIVGFMPTNYLFDRMKRKGKVVAFFSPGFTAVERRYESFMLVEKGYKGIELVTTHPYGDGDFVNYAMTATLALLKKHPDIKGIWACWDGPGTGAAKGVCAAGRKDIVVASVDGNRMALELLRDPEGCLDATLAQDGYEQGRIGARMALQVLQGKKVPRYVTLTNWLVTKENVHTIPEGKVWTQATEHGWDKDVIKRWEDIQGYPLPPVEEQAWLYSKKD